MDGKALVVYYSRTGTTRKVAEAIAGLLRCDIEEIKDTRSRAGAWGFVRSGEEATLKALPEIVEPARDPGEYGLVIVGTPVWAWTMSSPVRTYLTRYAARFRAVAFFLTTGGTGIERTFGHMEALCRKKPEAALGLTMPQVVKGDPSDKIRDFAARLSRQGPGVTE